MNPAPTWGRGNIEKLTHAFEEAFMDPVVPKVTPSTAEARKHAEWEYEILEDLGSDPRARLNELGMEGWMLVTASPYIFRRPRLDDQGLRSKVGFARD